MEIGDIFEFFKLWNSKYVDKCRIDEFLMDIWNIVFKDELKVKLFLVFCIGSRENINELEGILLCLLENGLLICFLKFFLKIVLKFCYLFEYLKDKFVCKSFVLILEKKVYFEVI